MSRKVKQHTRIHDLFSAFLGIFAALCLLSSPWNVDTEGPDPFYKGPLIFPIAVLSMMILASLPACRRLLRTAGRSSWSPEGGSFPYKTLVVLGLLIATLAGLNLVGLEISAFVFLVASQYCLGHRGPLKLLVLPLFMTGLIVLTFKHFLGVFFPTPLLAEWLWG